MAHPGCDGATLAAALVSGRIPVLSREEPLMPGRYGVEVTSDGTNGIRLIISGEVDLANAQMLLEAIMSVTPEPLHEVKADLSAVTFMDSSGLAVIIQAQQKLLEHQVRLVLVNPSSQVALLVQVAGLEGFFTIERSGVD
jgi:anti-sigma B factor antagonist